MQEYSPPKLFRRADGKLVAGVAGGLADHLGFPPIAVRAAFAVLAGFGGLGVILYAAFWAVVPQGAPTGGRVRRGGDIGQLLAFAAIGVGVLLLLQQVGLTGSGVVVWPAVIVSVGAALIWRQADERQRTRWAQLSPRFPWAAAAVSGDRRLAVLRLVAGLALVAIGIATFLVLSGNLAAARNGLLAAAVIVAGIALVTGPWWWRLWSDLSAERRERIRSQERADLAAHVHDSVLHTLALIQRHSGDPREVARLARSQERELRGWLYQTTADPAETFAAALAAIAAEVEDTYAITVETVVVGDCPVDEHVAALVQAGREALVNAGRHAGVAEVSLYAEVEPGEVSIFVRDRGKGFDPDTVPADRHGIAGSIRGRMDRHGGAATVRSAPGEGTEVRLTMTRQAEARS